MLSARQTLIREELEAGTGAAIGMAVDGSKTRTGLRIWFADLEERHGPVAELRPHGLKGYAVTLGFGDRFSISERVLDPALRIGNGSVRLAARLGGCGRFVARRLLSSRPHRATPGCWMATR